MNSKKVDKRNKAGKLLFILSLAGNVLFFITTVTQCSLKSEYKRDHKLSMDSISNLNELIYNANIEIKAQDEIILSQLRMINKVGRDNFSLTLDSIQLQELIAELRKDSVQFQGQIKNLEYFIEQQKEMIKNKDSLIRTYNYVKNIWPQMIKQSFSITKIDISPDNKEMRLEMSPKNSDFFKYGGYINVVITSDNNLGNNILYNRLNKYRDDGRYTFQLRNSNGDLSIFYIYINGQKHSFRPPKR